MKILKIRQTSKLPIRHGKYTIFHDGFDSGNTIKYIDALYALSDLINEIKNHYQGEKLMSFTIEIDKYIKESTNATKPS